MALLQRSTSWDRMRRSPWQSHQHARSERSRKIGLAGGAARLKVLENSAFEVQFEATLWGTIKELREVLALAESGRLSPIQLEFESLDRINEVYARMKKGQIAGRAVIRP